MVQREVADRFFAVAGDEGVRRGLGARSARRRADRLPPGLAHGLPAAAERRLGARRLSPPRAAGRLRRRQARGRGGVRPPPQDAARTRSSWPGSRTGRRRSRRARRGSGVLRPRAPRRSRRASSSSWSGCCRERAARPREDQPRTRRRPAPRRRQARGDDRAAARRPQPTGSSSNTPTALAVEGFAERHARPARAGARRRGGRRRAGLACPDRQADPRRRRPRRRELRRRRGARCSRTRRSTGRSRRRDCTALAAGLGADVPFFLAEGPQLGEGDGTIADGARAPQRYTVLLLLPTARRRRRPPPSTPRSTSGTAAAGYEDRRHGAALGALAAGDLARAPAERPRLLAAGSRAALSSAPSAPTSAAPGRPSTGCSRTRRRPRRPPRGSSVSAGSGSCRQRGRLSA